METKTNDNEVRRCHVCGGAMQLRGYKRVEHVGRLKVQDGTALQPTCVACGVVDLPLDALHMYEVRAARTVLCDAKSRVCGAELRSIRKTLGLTQKELAKLLDYDHATISRTEASESPVARATQLALLSLLDLVEHGVEPEELMSLADGGGPPSGDSPIEVRPHRRAC
jgi:DNA-binding transcriptional regulator YiaG